MEDLKSSGQVQAVSEINQEKKYLTVSTLGKVFSRRHFEIFSNFFQETGFEISCKLSPFRANV